MKQNATITFRNGDFYLTKIDNLQDSKSLAQRMVSITGGYLICNENRWGKYRTLIINLADVVCIEIEHSS